MSAPIDYVSFINCKTPEEVYAQVRTWISGLSEHEHTVRWVILDIHARVEAGMKEILFLHLSELVVCYKGKEDNYQASKSKLEKTIQKMAFSHVHRLLKPCFDAFDSTSLAHDLPAIDDLRNEVAHRSGNAATYKGRSPFTDHDCFAQVYVDSWSINQELGDFIEKLIDNSKEFRRRGWLHFLGKPIA